MKSDVEYLREAVEVSRQARASGNTPFGAILVGPEGEILLRQQNNEITEHKATGHAETQLAEAASMMFEKDFLWDCTMYTTCEPCPMCSGAVYWANIGHVVYGMSEADLLKLTGAHDQNPTFAMTAQRVFDAGQKDIKVEGPFDEVATEVAAVHQGYWA